MNDRLNPEDVFFFGFCPYDGSRLQERSHPPGDSERRCPICGFVDYQNPKPCMAVLIEKDRQLLLARRAVEPAKGKWDILGGFVQAGESLEQALKREILEETGLELTDLRYLGSFPDIYGPHRIPTLNFCFKAKPVNGNMRAASDVAELRWFSADELPRDLAFPHQRKLVDDWRKSAGN